MRLPRRRPGWALRGREVRHADPDPQEMQDKVKRLQAQEHLRHPWRNRWNRGGR